MYTGDSVLNLYTKPYKFRLRWLVKQRSSLPTNLLIEVTIMSNKFDATTIFEKFGLTAELSQLNKQSKISNGAHAKLVRAVVTKAYSLKSDEATSELCKALVMVSSVANATYGKATRWTIAQCGIEKQKGGAYAVKDYSKQQAVIDMLSNKSFTPVSAYTEYAKTEAKEKRAEKARNPLGATSLENFEELKGAIGALEKKFTNMSKALSSQSCETEDALKERNSKRDFLEAQCLEFRALTRILDLATSKGKKLAELEAVLKEIS